MGGSRSGRSTAAPHGSEGGERGAKGDAGIRSSSCYTSRCAGWPTCLVQLMCESHLSDSYELEPPQQPPVRPEHPLMVLVFPIPYLIPLTPASPALPP